MKIIFPYITPHHCKNEQGALEAQLHMIEKLQKLRVRSAAAYEQLHSELHDPDKHREKPMTGWADLELEKVTQGSRQSSGFATGNHRSWSIHLSTTRSPEDQRFRGPLLSQTAALL